MVNLRILSSIVLVGAMALTGCVKDVSDSSGGGDSGGGGGGGKKEPYHAPDAELVKYAEEKFGTTIDPNQNWELTNQNSVTIIADAVLADITAVAVLDNDPYVTLSSLLASKATSNGQKTTLTFRAPIVADTLYATCINSEGKCVARPFAVGIDKEVSFFEAPVPYEDAAATSRRARAGVDDPEIISYPTYKDFRMKDFVSVRTALFTLLPEGKDNRNALTGCWGGIARVKPNDFNFYEIPMAFMGGIGKPNQESDQDNLVCGWFYSDTSADKYNYFLYKDRFKNAFQPKYDAESKSYFLEGLYLMCKDADGNNSIQFGPNDNFDFNLAIDETLIDKHDIRVALFVMNGHLFAACEDGEDWDYNDRLFWFPYGQVNIEDVTDPFKPQPSTRQVWTYAWEDQDFGDYDLNDCVIQVQENEEDDSKLDITLVALGATRELWLGFENWSAKTYSDYIPVFDRELHEVMGIPLGKMANTGNGTLEAQPVKITLPKPAGFDFQKCSFILGARVDPDKRGVYESDYYAISIPRRGQDPHGVVVPGYWPWPTETTCIIYAYPKFADWAHNISDPTSKNWYMFPDSKKVVPILVDK